MTGTRQSIRTAILDIAGPCHIDVAFDGANTIYVAASGVGQNVDRLAMIDAVDCARPAGIAVHLVVNDQTVSRPAAPTVAVPYVDRRSPAQKAVNAAHNAIDWLASFLPGMES